jgi:hypothetical protein
MIVLRQFRDHVVRPVLNHLTTVEPRLGSQTAEDLLIGTALVESDLRCLEQQAGPAMGLFQIEPLTASDILERYLPDRRPDLLRAVWQMAVPGFHWTVQLPGNMHFGCAVARIKYWMAPEPLPEDIDGLGQYWKTHYNAGGKGSAAIFARKFRSHITHKG